MTQTSTSTPVPLRRNPEYIKYWSARFFAVLGSQVTYISFPLLALATSDSVLGASVVTAVTYGAPFLVSVPSGYIADRYPRRVVMIRSDLLSAITYIFLVALMVNDSLSIPILAIAAGLTASFSSLYLAAATAMLPSLVDETQVRRAVSINETRDFAIALAGPVVGAVLFVQSSHLPFLVNGIAFVMSAIFVATMRKNSAVGSDAPKSVSPRTALLGISIVIRNRSLALAIGTLACLSFALTLNFFSLIAYFNSTNNPVGSGVILAAQAAGGLIGGILAASANQRLRPSVVFALQGLMWFVTGATMLAWQDVWLTSIALILTWTITPSMRAVYQGYVAAAVPDEQRGRVASAAMLATSVTSPLGVLAAGALASVAPLAAFWVLCLVSFTSFLLIAVAAPRVPGGFLNAYHPAA